MRKVNSNRIYILLVLLLIFGLFQLSVIRLYGFTFYPDEFGYWANAASVLGYEWSEIASLGSYYSFGYSLLLMPILVMFKNGIVAYRVAVALNFVLIAIGFVLIYKISNILYRGQNDAIRRVLICAIATLYPPWIVFAQTTMAEALVFFLYILICFFFVNYLRSPNLLRLIPIVLVAVYMYSVHMRLIGVIVAFVITFMLIGLKDKRSRKLIFAMLVIGLVLVACLAYVKRGVISNVYKYTNASLLDANNYSGQLIKIVDIFTPKGFKIFCVEVLGKIYYLVIASFGVAVLAFLSTVRSVRTVIHGFTKKTAVGAIDYFKIFVMISAFAEIMITAIYMHRADRSDSLLYGRYEEFVVPIIMLIGIEEAVTLIKKRRTDHLIIWSVSSALSLIALAPFLTVFVDSRKDDMTQNAVNIFTAALCYINPFDEFHYAPFLWRGILIAVIMIMLFFIVMIFASGKDRSFLLVILLAAQILLAYQLSDRWTYRVNNYVYTNISLLDELNEHPERTIYYLHTGVTTHIDFYQFNMRNTKINIIWYDALETLDLSNGYLLVNWNEPRMEEIQNMFEKSIVEDMFTIFYNE